MKKGDKGKKVFGVILILAIFVSVFGGIVSAEDVSEDFTGSVADTKIQTAFAEDKIQSLSSQTEIFVGQGFDKCEIPTLSQMQNWITNSPYGAVNLYIGGSCRSCPNSALTASYVSQLSQQGWKFIPTWVGPQSACWGGSCGSISNDPATAYNQGISEANAAIDVAIDLGLALADGSGTIIYYDLEGYDTTNTACRNAAKSFISGWTAQLHARGSEAGVYGSACSSAISDFASISNVPDAIWPAHWIYSSYNSGATVRDVACLSNSLWVNHQRIRQYAGGHGETWGSVTLNIDCNVIDGIVASVGDKFNIGDTVRVTTNLNVRTGPGTGYPEITDPDYPGYAPAGTIGTVLSGPSSADSFIWWEVDYGPGLYSGWSVEGGLEKVDDNILPTVDAFSVTPASVTLGDTFTIPYTVSDTGGSGLKQVELWRKGTGVWEQIGDPISLVGEGDGPYSNSFYDAPTSIGTYEYGIHVVDNAGNLGLEPDPPGPIEVEVTLGCDGTDTSCGIYPNCENCNDHDGWYCNGNTREYRTFYCSGTSCTYTVTSSDNCNNYDGCSAYSNGCENRDYYCSGGSCLYTHSNRHTDYYDDWVYYCDGATVRKHRLLHNYYCDGGTCTDHTSLVDDQLVENCNDHDAWVDTGNTDWVPDPGNECQEKEQKEQKYRDYYCSGGACTYSETGTQWVDTGTTRNKDDDTICGCTASNTLKRCYSGVCTDTGICDSSICGADVACDGKEPGDSCAAGTCDSNCKCGGQAVGEDYGVFSGGLWFVDTTGDHAADNVFGYGFAGATPLVGDFDQDGTDDIAIVKAYGGNYRWFVDTNGDHVADEDFWFGFEGSTPLVGDFDQDGTDDIAIVGAYGGNYRWFVDTNGDHVVDEDFWFGFEGSTPLVGDIDQDGTDDIAVIIVYGGNYRWFVDTNGDHVADEEFWFGFEGAIPLVGDIDRDSTDDIAIVGAYSGNYRWFVDTNFDKTVDQVFWFGFAGATPLVGDMG